MTCSSLLSPANVRIPTSRRASYPPRLSGRRARCRAHSEGRTRVRVARFASEWSGAGPTPGTAPRSDGGRCTGALWPTTQRPPSTTVVTRPAEREERTSIRAVQLAAALGAALGRADGPVQHRTRSLAVLAARGATCCGRYAHTQQRVRIPEAAAGSKTKLASLKESRSVFGLVEETA